MSNSSMSYDNSCEILELFISELNCSSQSCPANNGIDYVKKIEKDFSINHAWIKLFLDYHTQVCNGGHIQYIENGYHSSENVTPFDSFTSNDDLHRYFIKLTKEIKKEWGLPILDKLISTSSNLQMSIDYEQYIEGVCFKCKGNSSIYNPAFNEFDGKSTEEEFILCDNCHGRGYGLLFNDNYKRFCNKTRSRCADLDEEYYKYDEKIIIEIADYIKTIK